MTVTVGSRWAGANSRDQFTVLAVWCPNEEPDAWVKYCNQNSTEYTCRLEAFTARFSSLPNPT
jgi:hypothetical protein